MVKKIYIAIFLIAILCVAIAYAVTLLTQPPQTPSETAVSGIKEGNVFTYGIQGLSTKIDENATIPASFLELNQTQYYRVNITSVSGSEVSYNSTWRFTNGTELHQSGQINVATGAGSPEFWPIYAANLTINNLSRPSGSDGVTVNDTETRTYKDDNRATNLLSMQSQFYDSSDPTYTKTYNDYMYVYFDKQTGMLVELRNIKLYNAPQLILTIEWKLTDSNAWAIS